MKKTKPAARLSKAADRHLKRSALLFSFLPPLADTLILFPLMQMVLANGGDGVVYQILSVISQLIGLAGFFAIIALSVYCVFADAMSALGRAIALQGISYLVSTVLLRTLMFWLLALVNDTLRPVYAISNYTLSYWTDSSGMMLIWSALSFFINAVMLMLLLTVVVAVALLLHRRQKEGITLESLASDAPERSAGQSLILLSLRIATLIYLVQALANQLYQTVVSVSDLSASEILGQIGQVVAPYFLLAIFAWVGYWLMQVIARLTASKVLALCKD